MRHLIILAALAVSAPAWGQNITILCSNGPAVTVPDVNVQWSDPCTNRNVVVAQTVQPAATPDELKAAAAQFPNILSAVIETAKQLAGNPGADPSAAPLLREIGQTVTDGIYGIAIGYCAQANEGQTRFILFGDHTTAPPLSNGFVNIGNRWCGWRDTGERAACPAPEPECGKGK